MKAPDFIEPQLAQLVDAPPPGLGWLYEIKYDGYRMMCRLDRTGARFYSRNHNEWTVKLADLAGRMSRLNLGTGWLDGEIVVFDQAGKSDFQLLQNAMDRSRSASVRFVAFDVPFWAGRDLRGLPLDDRLDLLEDLLAGGDTSTIMRSQVLRLSRAADGPAVWKEACKVGLEGLIGKRRDAPYKSGRSTSWIKLKCRPRQEFVVGGWTSPAGSRQGFGSLLVGVREGKKLRYAGRVGTGYNEQTLRALTPKLKALASTTNPFTAVPPESSRWTRGERPDMHWVRPELVAEVAFNSWTNDGKLRQPSFIALREDKSARDVKRERAK